MRDELELPKARSRFTILTRQRLKVNHLIINLQVIGNNAATRDRESIKKLKKT